MEPSVVPDHNRLRDVRGWSCVPPLRLDLRFVRNHESKLFRVCDPQTQKFIELYELECLVVQAIDGERTVDDLTAFARTYNSEITREQIEQLIVQLLSLGLLEEEREPTKPGHGKVIPLPVANEFAAFRNEVVLDLQRGEALKWTDVSGPTRTPFFAAKSDTNDLDLDSTNLVGADEIDFDDTHLSVDRDPFRVLERSRDSMVHAAVSPPERAASPLPGIDDDTILSSASSPDPSPLYRRTSLPQGHVHAAPVPQRPVPHAPPTFVPAAPSPPAPSPAPQPRPEEPAARPAEPARPAATPASVASEQEKLWQASQDGKRKWHRRTSVRILIALGVVLLGSMIIQYPLYVTAPCSITPAEHVYVRSAINGVIAEILVDEGSKVKQGDVIARLDDRDLSADRRKAHAEVERIEADLQRLRVGARPEELSQQRAVLGARQTAVAFAVKEARRRAKMLAEGVGSRKALEEAQLDLSVKQNAAAEAAAALRLLQAGTRSEEVAAQEAALKRAKAELDFVEQKISDMVVIRAPIDGVILTAKFRERLRERVEAGGLVCEIANTATVRAEIFVPERETDSVAPGMDVVVKVESFPTRPFAGKVDFIAPAVELRDNTSVVRVVAILDNPDGLLRQNMTGYGEVECGDRTLFNLATRRLLRWIRVRFLI